MVVAELKHQPIDKSVRHYGNAHSNLTEHPGKGQIAAKVFQKRKKQTI